MAKLFLDIVNISFAASWLIAAVVIIRLALKKRAPKWTACLLWAVVGIRLVLPFTLESDLSLLPSKQTVNTEAVYAETSLTEDNSDTEEIINGGTQDGAEKPNTAPYKPADTSKAPTQYIDFGIAAIDDRVNTALEQTVTQSPAESENPLKKAADIASIIWVCGMAAMAVYACINYALLKKRIAAAIPDEGGIRRSENVGSPFILGMLRPKIYLPFGLEGETEMHVVAHERAHLRRRDHLIKPFGYAVLTVYWFNPLVWLAYILLCRDIEMACDEKVVKNMSAEARKAYASALLECGIKHSIIAACPVAFGEIGVKQRVKNALNYKKPMFWIILAAVIICIAVAVFFLTSPAGGGDTSEASNQSEESSAPETAGKNIEFEEYYFDAYLTEYKCNSFPNDMTTFTATNAEEFALIRNDTNDEEFLEFADSLPADFFDSKMLIFAYSWQYPTTVLDVTEIKASGDTVTLTVTYEQTSEKLNTYTKLIVAAVEKQDAQGFANYQAKHISLFDAYQPKKENKIDFTQHIFDGEYYYDGHISIPDVNYAIAVTSDAELQEFLADYEYNNFHSGADMRAFAQALPDNYFDEKALIVIPTGMQTTAMTRSRISEVYSDNEYLMVYASTDDSYMLDSTLNNSIFAAEINKADIKDGAKIRCMLDYIGYDGTDNGFNVADKVSVVAGSYNSGFVPGINTSEPYNNACFEVIDSQEALNAFLAEYSYDGTEYSFAEFANSLGDDYFESNMFIAVPTFRKDSTQFKATAIKSGDMLETLNIVMDHTSDSLIPTNECIIVVEMPKMLVSNRFKMIVEPLGPEKTEVTVNSQTFDYSIYYAKSGADLSALYETSATYGKDSLPYVIDSADGLEEFLNTYLAHAGDTNGFKSYASGLENSFFNERSLVVLYVSAPTTPTAYELTSVFTVGHILVATLNYEIIGIDTQVDEKLIVAEVAKEEIAGCEVFQTLVTEINAGNEFPLEINIPYEAVSSSRALPETELGSLTEDDLFKINVYTDGEKPALFDIAEYDEKNEALLEVYVGSNDPKSVFEISGLRSADNSITMTVDHKHAESVAADNTVQVLYAVVELYAIEGIDGYNVEINDIAGGLDYKGIFDDE